MEGWPVTQPLPRTLPAFSDAHAAQRAARVGGSEVGALWGWGGLQSGTMPPSYLTKLGLYMRKAAEFDGTADPTETEPRIRPGGQIDPRIRGTILEDAVAQLAAIWIDHPVYRMPLEDGETEIYWPHPYAEHLGTTPDPYEIIHPDWGPGLMSIKTAGFHVARHWAAVAEGLHGRGAPAEPPLGYQLQIQAELACSDGSRIEPGARFEWGCIVAQVGLDRIQVFPAPEDGESVGGYRRDDAIHGQMIIETDRFWLEHVEPRVPPPADFERDFERLAALQASLQVGSSVNLRADAAYTDAGDRLLAARKEESTARQRKKEAAAELAEIEIREGNPEHAYGTWGTSSPVKVKASKCICGRVTRKASKRRNYTAAKVRPGSRWPGR